MQQTLIPMMRPSLSQWAVLQGLTMRLRALVDAVHDADLGNERARRPSQVEAALRSLEADISLHADRLTEDLLWARTPRAVHRLSPVGDIPDLVGLA